MSDLAVRCVGVGKDYPRFTLSDIDFELPTGSVLGFIGANGAGKSTTLRILLGLVRQDRGSVEVLGLPMPAQEVAVKADVGYVAEDLQLYDSASVQWHMDFIAGIYPGWNPPYAGNLLRRFELDPHQKIRELSLGQRVKTLLLLALARRPRLLVLDEPTLGLDPIARQEVLGEMMEALADERRTVLFSSQNTLDVEQISDHLLFIDKGRIVGRGDKETFLESWRRLRLDVLPGTVLPTLPGVVGTSTTGRLTVVTTERHDDAQLAAYRAAGITVQAVEKMTLEEIFVICVQQRRKGADA